MNSRGFLIIRMLIEFIIGSLLAFAAVDIARVHISRHMWVDIPCRLILAVLAMAILADAFRLRKDEI
jgi:hypothetical protein